jgi:hypothetical protein
MPLFVISLSAFTIGISFFSKIQLFRLIFACLPIQQDQLCVSTRLEDQMGFILVQERYVSDFQLVASTWELILFIILEGS